MKISILLVIMMISIAMAQKRHLKNKKKQIITYSQGEPVPVTTIYKRPERVDYHFPTYSVSNTFTPAPHTHIVTGTTVLNTPSVFTPTNTVFIGKKRLSKKNKKQ